MKKLLIILFAWTFFGVRICQRLPILSDLCYSITALIVAFILIKYFDSYLWTITLFMVLPDFFIDVIHLISPTESNSLMISVGCTLVVAFGYLTNTRLRWNY